jgi:hypothetical protein
MAHFDEHVYKSDDSTMLHKFLDALCGDAGVGSLKKEIFLHRLSGALDGIYGAGLDFIFGGVRFLSRTSAESYSYAPENGMLTSTQWDEVFTKDAAYRNRIREFFTAAGKGNTIEAIRLAVHAATSADCQVLENWRYIDNFGLGIKEWDADTNTPTLANGSGRSGDLYRVSVDGSLDLGAGVTSYTVGEHVIYSGGVWVKTVIGGYGRALSMSYAAVDMSSGHRVYFTDADPAVAQSQAEDFIADKTDWAVEEVRSRSEVTVVPHKGSYAPNEARVLREMLDKITPQDTVVTINPDGLAVNAPLPIRAVASDSVYFQVEKIVTGTPDLESLPAPELLAIDLNPGENWLLSGSPELAPYARFNITQEYGYYYLASGGDRSPIDTVTYGTLQSDGTVKTERDLEWWESTEQYDSWINYEKADSPDNYPGGKYGLTPTTAPAVGSDRKNYQFPYASQADYVAEKKAWALSLGGEADDMRYRLPIQRTQDVKRIYTPDLAIAASAPTRDSLVTSGWSARSPRTSSEVFNPSIFVTS